MKIKTAELTGAALDWAVAKCEGLEPYVVDKQTAYTSPHHGARIYFRPSTDWSQGGPIIERANITIIRANDDYGVDAQGFCNNKRIPSWFAECGRWVGHNLDTSYEGEHMDPTFMIGEADGHYGPTPLIAAMRCYVASRLGDEVEVPNELA